jgi:riboflavin synthase
MFTGIVTQQGKVLGNIASNNANKLLIQACFDALEIGESIAINGACLTLLSAENGCMAFDVSPETLNLTNLGNLKVGDSVNLERAMLASSRFGGHYVSGHIDTTAMITALTAKGDFLEMVVSDFGIPAQAYLLPKGSIAINGVSLTINEVTDTKISLLLIPHTQDQTNLGKLKINERVNIEFDYFARIIVHQLTLAKAIEK